MSAPLFPLSTFVESTEQYVFCESVYIGVRCMLPADHQLGRRKSEPGLMNPRWHGAWDKNGRVEWVDG